MDDMEIYGKLNQISKDTQIAFLFEEDSEKTRLIAEHRVWLQNIRRERPSVAAPHKVGVYIRYFNQTKYENYLYYHKKQFMDTIALCPKWEFIDFYIDEGSVAPNMESAPEWCRLLEDCEKGKVDLIITQKVSNVSRKSYEITLLSRMLASMKQPVGIYFLSEDIYTLASYYISDMKDMGFFPDGWQMLPEEEEGRRLLND